MSNSNKWGALLSLAVLMAATGMSVQLGSAFAADQQPASTTPTETPAKSGPVLVAQPSDTIGEAADKQRLMRMLAEKHRTAGTAPGGDVMVPSIVLKRAPGTDNAATQPKSAATANEPQVILNEVLRGPSKLMAGIELNGVNRYVSVGHDIGNGWRVQSISQYNVVLVEPESASANSSATGKSKTSKTASANTPRLNQLVLPLGLRTVVAPGPASASRTR